MDLSVTLHRQEQERKAGQEVDQGVAGALGQAQVVDLLVSRPRTIWRVATATIAATVTGQLSAQTARTMTATIVAHVSASRARKPTCLTRFV